jgi:hypothetical protein
MIVVVISNIFGECHMKAQVVSTTFGTHGMSLITLVDKIVVSTT